MVDEPKIETSGYIELVEQMPKPVEELKSSPELLKEIATLAKASPHPMVISPAQHEEVRTMRKTTYDAQKAETHIMSEEETQLRHLHLALILLGECLTSLGNALQQSTTQRIDKLGSIACGLERAACYVRGVPYKPNPTTRED